MKLRKLPGAAALGLLAFLMAHTFAFGDGHAVGGAYHEWLSAAALAAGFGFAFGAMAFAFAAREKWADGSVLAMRLAALLPDIGPILASSVLWFALVERNEGRHAGAGTAIVALALAVAAVVIHLVASALLGCIRAIVQAIFNSAFADRTPIWIHYAYVLVRVTSEHARFRLFARPPPGAMHSACI